MLPKPICAFFFAVPILCGNSPAQIVGSERARAANGPAVVGDRVADHEFATAVGHGGRNRLSDWFGHPVLVVGFKTNLNTSMHGGRLAYDLWKKYGDQGLIVILTDRTIWRAHARDSVASFWLKIAAWMPFLASVPTNHEKADLPIQWPVPRDDRSAVLIGVDGKLLAVGSLEDYDQKENRKDFRATLKKLVAGEVQRRKKGWGENPAARQARALGFGRNQLAKAADVLAKALADGADPELEAVRAELDAHVQSQLKGIGYLRDDGQIVAAAAAMKSLTAATQGESSWKALLGPVAASLATDENKAQLALDKALQKLVRPVLGTPPKGKASAKILAGLRTFAAKHKDTAVGARAARLEYRVHSLLCDHLRMRWDAVEEKVKKLLGN